MSDWEQAKRQKAQKDHIHKQLVNGRFKVKPPPPFVLELWKRLSTLRGLGTPNEAIRDATVDLFWTALQYHEVPAAIPHIMRMLPATLTQALRSIQIHEHRIPSLVQEAMAGNTLFTNPPVFDQPPAPAPAPPPPPPPVQPMPVRPPKPPSPLQPTTPPSPARAPAHPAPAPAVVAEEDLSLYKDPDQDDEERREHAALQREKARLKRLIDKQRTAQQHLAEMQEAHIQYANTHKRKREAPSAASAPILSTSALVPVAGTRRSYRGPNPTKFFHDLVPMGPAYEVQGSFVPTVQRVVPSSYRRPIASASSASVLVDPTVILDTNLFKWSRLRMPVGIEEGVLPPSPPTEASASLYDNATGTQPITDGDVDVYGAFQFGGLDFPAVSSEDVEGKHTEPEPQPQTGDEDTEPESEPEPLKPVNTFPVWGGLDAIVTPANEAAWFAGEQVDSDSAKLRNWASVDSDIQMVDTPSAAQAAAPPSLQPKPSAAKTLKKKQKWIQEDDDMQILDTPALRKDEAARNKREKERKKARLAEEAFYADMPPLEPDPEAAALEEEDLESKTKRLQAEHKAAKKAKEDADARQVAYEIMKAKYKAKIAASYAKVLAEEKKNSPRSK